MNLIIFEGIASSGKTTVERLLIERLMSVEIVGETETLMPLIDNRDVDTANKYLSTILKKISTSRAEHFILDRFHVTHAFRTNSTLKEFSNIETALNSYGNSLIILLTIHPNFIRERIEETMKYRGSNWNKGSVGAQTIDEKVLYYTEQQKKLKSLILESCLPHIEIDTTKKDWDDAVKGIFIALQNHTN